MELVTPEDISEQAHLFAKMGKEKQAMELLDYIEKKRGYLNSFEKVYKGIATGKKNISWNPIIPLKCLVMILFAVAIEIFIMVLFTNKAVEK